MKLNLFASAATLLFVVASPALAQTVAPTADAPRGHGKVDFLKANDANTDGAVSRAEFDAQRTTDYSRDDTNRDGRVTEAEYVSAFTTRLDAELAARRAASVAQAHVRYGILDANKDAAMTRAEFDVSGTRMFTQLDTNGDGVVDDKDTADRY